MECLKCGGATWDNRAKKAAGEMKPNGPDFACKDKEGCGWALWPEKKKTAPPPARTTGPKWTWNTLSQTYFRCLALANKHLASVKGATSADVVAAAATLFISASRDGVYEAPKPEELAERPRQLQDDEDGVPF